MEGPSVGEGTQRRFVLEGGHAIFVEGEDHQKPGGRGAKEAAHLDVYGVSPSLERSVHPSGQSDKGGDGTCDTTCSKIYQSFVSVFLSQ